jgi:transcriptional regulator with XRE-family HTH domain
MKKRPNKGRTTKLFADRLQDLIKDSGKSIKELSRELNVSEGSLSKYQNDEAEAGITSMASIANYFKVSTDFLLGRTDVKTPDIEPQAIWEKTGLSEKAVDVLIKLKESDPYVFSTEKEPLIDIFSALIESDSLFSIIQSIALTKKQYLKAKVNPEYRRSIYEYESFHFMKLLEDFSIQVFENYNERRK